jgi:dienelactone hydrolase
MKAIISGLFMVVFSAAAQSAVQTKAIEYQDGDTTLTGHLYWDDAIEGVRPGVLLIHEWWGLNDYAKKRAGMLAELGFVAFAADMYGDGHVTNKPDQARTWMQEVTADVEGWRDRALLGLQQLKASGMVSGDNLAAIGYCFGGATVLQMGYANAPIKGVVSFHGSLPAAPEESKGRIGPKLLVLHGYADAWIGPDIVANFRAKLEEAGADWEMNTYGGARHGFTNPEAAKFGIDNLVYDQQADERSWARMRAFFGQLFE